MCDQHRLLIFLTDPECRTIKVEEFTDVVLDLLNFVIYPVDGQVDEAPRDLGQQRFEPEPLLQGLFRSDELFVRSCQICCSFFDPLFEFIRAFRRASSACLDLAISC